MIKDTIFTRRTVRKFKDDPVDREKLEEVLMYASMGPSNGNAHPVEFLVVEEKEGKTFLAQLEKFGTAYVKEAPAVIVLTADKDLSKYWVEEGAIAASYLQLLLEEEEYSTAWINVHGNTTSDKEDSEEAVKKYFGIPENYGVICMIPVGKKNETVKKRKEFPIGEKVHYNQF